MNWLVSLYPGNSTIYFILNAFIQTSIIILIGWSVISLRRLESAPLKYGIWLAVLAGIIICPLFIIGDRKLGINFLNIIIPLGQPATGLNTVIRADIGVMNYYHLSLIIIGIIWLTGSLFFLLRLIYGLLVLVRLKEKLQDISLSESITPILVDVRTALGLKHSPAVKTSARISAPLSVGLLNPIIIFPAILLKTLSEDDIRDILTHECAHIIHRDHLIGFLQRLVQVVWWFNPLIYVMNHHITKASEEICDNYVLNSGRLAPDYAQCLVNLAEHTIIFCWLPATVGIIYPRWRLEDRIDGLFKKGRNMMTKLNTIAVGFLATILILTLAAIAGCGVYSDKTDCAKSTQAQIHHKSHQGTNGQVTAAENDEDDVKGKDGGEDDIQEKDDDKDNSKDDDKDDDSDDKGD